MAPDNSISFSYKFYPNQWIWLVLTDLFCGSEIITLISKLALNGQLEFDQSAWMRLHEISTTIWTAVAAVSLSMVPLRHWMHWRPVTHCQRCLLSGLLWVNLQTNYHLQWMTAVVIRLAHMHRATSSVPIHGCLFIFLIEGLSLMLQPIVPRNATPYKDTNHTTRTYPIWHTYRKPTRQ